MRDIIWNWRYIDAGTPKFHIGSVLAPSVVILCFLTVAVVDLNSSCVRALRAWLATPCLHTSFFFIYFKRSLSSALLVGLPTFEISLYAISLLVVKKLMAFFQYSTLVDLAFGLSSSPGVSVSNTWKLNHRIRSFGVNSVIQSLVISVPFRRLVPSR